jgi:hypothetical protein
MGATISSVVGFKEFHFLPKNVPAGFEHPQDGRIDFFLEFEVGSANI